MPERFSSKHGFSQPDAEISIRHDAPDELRSVLVHIAYECGFSPTPLRELVCRVLRKRPNPQNWSEYPNVDQEVRGLIDNCAWFEVYDVIEEIHRAFESGDLVTKQRRGHEHEGHKFAEEINRYFRVNGYGWQLADGQIQVKGSESFEETIHSARQVLAETARNTADTELHQALLDLSRRPEADVTGAIQHSIAALECVMRDVTGDPKSTLGDLLKRYPDAFPKPVDQSVEKAWGYASEMGRHLREGRPPTFEEAELIVGLAGVLCRYLVRKVRT